MLLNDFSHAMIIGLFGVLVGLIFYVLRTSSGREEKLTSLLECYSEQLSRLARQLDEVSHNVADISRRFERMELTQRTEPHINVSNVGERAQVGQSAQGHEIEQAR